MLGDESEEESERQDGEQDEILGTAVLTHTIHDRGLNSILG
jgi:hypothetical protein